MLASQDAKGVVKKFKAAKGIVDEYRACYNEKRRSLNEAKGIGKGAGKAAAKDGKGKGKDGKDPKGKGKVAAIGPAPTVPQAEAKLKLPNDKHATIWQGRRGTWNGHFEVGNFHRVQASIADYGEDEALRRVWKMVWRDYCIFYSLNYEEVCPYAHEWRDTDVNMNV